jgi:hypothetical protein
MAISSVLTNSFKTELLKGFHSFDTSGATPAGSVFKIALYNSSAALGTTTTAYTTTEELATATGYTRPGNTLVNTGVGVSTVTSYTDFTDTSWTSASFTARGCLIYNSSSVTGLTADAAVCSIDFGGDKTSTAGSFTIQFPAKAAATAVIRIA